MDRRRFAETQLVEMGGEVPVEIGKRKNGD
jgi:hypothetical protein